MEESTGQGGWTILKRKHGDATNFPPAAVCMHIESHLFIQILVEPNTIYFLAGMRLEVGPLNSGAALRPSAGFRV